MYLGREIPVEQKNTTLILSLDFDGCTDTPEARDKLIDTIHAYCLEHPQYSEIVLVIGSLRQSLFSDLNNAIMNSVHFEGELLSCSILLSEFAEKLSSKLNTTEEEKIKVISEPLLASDIYNDFEPGTTIDLIKEINYKEFIGTDRFQYLPVCDFFGKNVSYFTKENFEEWYSSTIGYLDEATKNRFFASWGINQEEFDSFVELMDTLHLPQIQVTNKNGRDLVVIEKTGQLRFSGGDLFYFDDIAKCLSLYIIKHHLAIKFAKNFDLLHVDDRIDLLTAMDSYFNDNTYVIPRGCTFRGLEWNAHEMEAKYGAKILGTGDINPDYIKDSKSIANICLKYSYSSIQQIPEYLKAKKLESIAFIDRDNYPAIKIIRPKFIKPKPNVGLSFFEPAEEKQSGNLAIPKLRSEVKDVTISDFNP
jgi:hypothetical protein